MFCPYCGESLSEEFRFCPKCGKSIPSSSDRSVNEALIGDCNEPYPRPAFTPLTVVSRENLVLFGFAIDSIAKDICSKLPKLCPCCAFSIKPQYVKSVCFVASAYCMLSIHGVYGEDWVEGLDEIVEGICKDVVTLHDELEDCITTGTGRDFALSFGQFTSDKKDRDALVIALLFSHWIFEKLAAGASSEEKRHAAIQVAAQLAEQSKYFSFEIEKYRIFETIFPSGNFPAPWDSRDVGESFECGNEVIVFQRAPFTLSEVGYREVGVAPVGASANNDIRFLYALSSFFKKGVVPAVLGKKALYPRSCVALYENNGYLSGIEYLNDGVEMRWGYNTVERVTRQWAFNVLKEHSPFNNNVVGRDMIRIGAISDAYRLATGNEMVNRCTTPLERLEESTFVPIKGRDGLYTYKRIDGPADPKLIERLQKPRVWPFG